MRYRAYAGCVHCGKQIYPSRKAARTAAKKYFAGQHFSAYECVAARKQGMEHVWHFGHLPKMIINGEWSRP